MSKEKEVTREYKLAYQNEEHPFNDIDSCCNSQAEYLIVGTFPPRRFFTKELEADDVDWFYGSKDNAFWGVGGKKRIDSTSIKL